MYKLAAATALILLTACGGETLRFDTPVAQSEAKIPVSVGSIEVRDVSLPLYASQEVIFYEDETGAVVSNDDLLWADDPERAITEGLALALAAQTRATVAAEPWPFFDRPDVQLDVRISRALPGRDGIYRMVGQYFVGSPQGNGPERARRFALQEPYQTLAPASISAARAKLVADLASLIARDGL